MSPPTSSSALFPSDPGSVSYNWSTLPAEISSYILTTTWDISQASNTYSGKRNPCPGVLSAVSSQWAQETRRCMLEYIEVETREDAQWLLDHLAAEKDGKLVWPFTPLVKQLCIALTKRHIEDMTAYGEELMSLIIRLPWLKSLSIGFVKPPSESITSIISSAAALKNLRALHLSSGWCDDIRPILESIARVPSVRKLTIRMSYGKLDAPVLLPQVHTFWIGIYHPPSAAEILVQHLRRSFPSIPDGSKIWTKESMISAYVGSSKGAEHIDIFALDRAIQKWRRRERSPR